MVILVAGIMPALASGKKDSAGKVVIGTLNGPSGIPCAYMMQDFTEHNGTSVEYQSFAAANQLLPKLLSGEVDVGFLPPNVAAKAYASGGNIVCIGIAGNGMLSLVTADKSITGVADLAGKTVTVAGAGATPEYLTRYLLDKAGVTAELDFSIPNAQIAAALLSGKTAYAVVPEPFSTVAMSRDAGIVRALDIQQEFAKAGGTAEYPMTLIVARAEFAKANPSLVRRIQAEYDKAQKATKADPAQTGALAERFGLGLTATVVQAAVPGANFTYVPPEKARGPVETLLQVFLDFAPESVGGALPDAGFYYKK